MINMPFALYPLNDEITSVPSSDGGERGIALTTAALRAVKDYMDNSVSDNVSAIVLCYSLGKALKGEWEIERICDSIFTSESVSFTILNGEKLWRVNGKKEQNNPMPIRGKLSLKGRCSHTFAEGDMQRQVDGYRRLEEKLERDGFTHLGYGVVHVQKRKMT